MKGAGFESLYDISYAQGFFEMKNNDQSLEDMNAPHNQLASFLDEGKKLVNKVVEENTVSTCSLMLCCDVLKQNESETKLLKPITFTDFILIIHTSGCNNLSRLY